MSERKYIPTPLVEEHYHIRELIERQEKRTEDKQRAKDVEKNRDSILKDIQGFKDIETLDFHCSKCKLDFIARAKKQTDSWDTIAYYKTKHSCGNWCIRHITDRRQDKYFFLSKKILKQRAEQHNDLLQPFQTGYNTLYGKK